MHAYEDIEHGLHSANQATGRGPLVPVYRSKSFQVCDSLLKGCRKVLKIDRYWLDLIMQTSTLERKYHVHQEAAGAGPSQGAQLARDELQFVERPSQCHHLQTSLEAIALEHKATNVLGATFIDPAHEFAGKK
ncbi:hypothetical protein Tdes44962_MAKER00922 [Teratosphaeria destructans]|uniref:Uncharacterized protein n=1 Tax=Teratosphaeria destructans TaxID=418781 RepID=A0A9W7SJX3_9PEZI|nr:hypothetical protein Tdes44962_MAKER00922 [Teratosphaeria destructans]